MIDYRERRSVIRNATRKKGPSKGPIVVVALVLCALSYAGGVGTGYLVFHAPPAAPARPVVPPAPGQQQPAQPPAPPKAPDPTLTFYNTLPSGKGIIGTGLNPRKEEKKVTAPPIAPQGAAPTPASAAGANDKAGEQQSGAEAKEADTPVKKTETLPKKPETSKGKFSVQVAACESKAEAESIRSRVAGAGLEPFIVETTVPGKGKWYRVRVGRHLDQKSAHDLAAKAGKGSIVILE